MHYLKPRFYDSKPQCSCQNGQRSQLLSRASRNKLLDETLTVTNGMLNVINDVPEKFIDRDSAMDSRSMRSAHLPNRERAAPRYRNRSYRAIIKDGRPPTCLADELPTSGVGSLTFSGTWRALYLSLFLSPSFHRPRSISRATRSLIGLIER